jgi:hypothetical protein
MHTKIKTDKKKREINWYYKLRKLYFKYLKTVCVFISNVNSKNILENDLNEYYDIDRRK